MPSKKLPKPEGGPPTEVWNSRAIEQLEQRQDVLRESVDGLQRAQETNAQDTFTLNYPVADDDVTHLFLSDTDAECDDIAYLKGLDKETRARERYIKQMKYVHRLQTKKERRDNSNVVVTDHNFVDGVCEDCAAVRYDLIVCNVHVSDTLRYCKLDGASSVRKSATPRGPDVGSHRDKNRKHHSKHKSKKNAKRQTNKKP